MLDPRVQRVFRVCSPIFQQLHKVVALPEIELGNFFPASKHVLHLAVRGPWQEHGVVCTGRQQQLGLKVWSK